MFYIGFIWSEQRTVVAGEISDMHVLAIAVKTIHLAVFSSGIDRAARPCNAAAGSVWMDYHA